MEGFERVVSQGWLGRLGGAFKGLFAGAILLLVALGLQFWNEGRTLKRDAALAEARATVQVVAEARPDASLDGRLVHVSGEAAATDAVTDEEFGVRVPALALRRRVEMYQWQEKRERREESQAGGGTRKVTQYRYEMRWDEDLIDSSRFEQRSGHENPRALPYASQTRRAAGVSLGGYTLAPAVAREIGGWEHIPAAQVELPPNLAASFRAEERWFVSSSDVGKPMVGDVRVRFERVPAGTVSVIARQQGTNLVPHSNADGAELLLVDRGQLGASAMFDAAGTRNSRAGWLLRGVGFALAFVGFTLLFRPLVVLADVMPLFGRLAGMGSAIVAAICAALTSALGIGSGWLWYRPWLSGLIVLALLAAGAWIWRRRDRIAAVPPPPPGPMPPPPPPRAQA